jgi:hypothetical protein
MTNFICTAAGQQDPYLVYDNWTEKLIFPVRQKCSETHFFCTSAVQNESLCLLYAGSAAWLIFSVHLAVQHDM